ncbi:MAG TPA: GTP-binding protein [Lachnospiraceae bacterium]|nr:GTP-binding protein [Lachnospiraceae bacterium]
MTKIDVVSGFLGAGKTTLIKKLLKEAWKGEQVVLIENEFGEIGIDGGFLKDAGIEIKEMNSGCICCSLVGDFGTSLKEVLAKYSPDRIVIEPSGVGKLSDVVGAVEKAELGDGVVLNSAVAVVDVTKCKLYIKNFGEFFVNQVEHAGTIILSRTDKMSEDKLKNSVDLLREHNKKATIVTTPWDSLDGMSMKEAMEGADDLLEQLLKEVSEQHEHEHCDHDHDHDHDHEHCDHDHDHEHEHCHHDHDHDHEHCHHEHEHDENCTCGCHDHDHHGHHHADEVFTSWGMETPAKYTKEDISSYLEQLEDEKTYGFVLRAKGMVPAEDGSWIYFDYVPGESDVRTGVAQTTGKFCVIGSKLVEEHFAELFAK